MNHSLIARWLERKLAAGLSPLPGVCTISHEINKLLGPRSCYAKVVLTLEPAKTFEFVSQVQWPAENYEPWVIDGILDALFGVQHRPMIGAKFRLIEVGYHPVNSAPIAYYWAAKVAVGSYLSSIERP